MSGNATELGVSAFEEETVVIKGSGVVDGEEGCVPVNLELQW